MTSPSSLSHVHRSLRIVLLIAGCLPFSLPAAGGPPAGTPFRVARDNGGRIGHEPHLLDGGDYRYPEQDLPVSPILPKDSPARSVAFAESVTFGYSGLVKGARYRLRVTFLSEHGHRIQRVSVDDTVLESRLVLPDGIPVVREWDVPDTAKKDGRFILRTERIAGPNAVVSVVEVWSDIPGELTHFPEPAISFPRLSPLPENVDGADIPSLSLDGVWQFRSDPPAEFASFRGASADGWKPIRVPGEWVMQGFQVPSRRRAGFRRLFSLPEKWLGKRVRLRFNAVFSRCRVWVNGEKAGEHLGGFTPFEFDVTDAVHPGENTVALAVWSDSLADTLASASKYAVHPLGGIIRPVRLFVLPPVNLAFVHVSTALNRDNREGTAHVAVGIAHDGDAPVGNRVRLRLVVKRWSPVRNAVTKGPPAATAEMEMNIPPVDEISRSHFSLRVERPALWDFEHPNLYELRVDLLIAGKCLETVSRRFGFRTVVVRGNGLFVNGRRIKLRGINRHEVHPLTGRSIDDGLRRRDVSIFRAANINLIRTCHYPPGEGLLNAADELGMFVEEEAPFCWANPAAGSFAVVHEATVRQTLEMVERDRTHPSVLIWSLGNESGWTRHFAAAAKAVRELDPTRPLIFEKGVAPAEAQAAFCDLGNIHYPGPRGPQTYAAAGQPVFFGEYCHLNAYNRRELAADPGVRDAWGRGLAAMWDAMRSSPGVLGGAIWSGIDDSFYLPARDAWVGYGAWGPIDGWRRPKPEYWHVKKAYSPVRVHERRLVRPTQGKVLRLTVENRYVFTDLAEVRTEWAALTDDAAAAIDRVRTRRAGNPRDYCTDAWENRPVFPVPTSALRRTAVSARPGETATIELPLSARAVHESAFLYLRFTDPRGFVADEYLLPIEPGRQPRKTVRQRQPRTVRPELRRLPDGTLEIVRGVEKWRIDGKRGVILSGSVNGSNIVTGGPDLMILPLNGSGVTQMTPGMKAVSPFTEPCHDWSCREVRSSLTPDGLVEVRICGQYREAGGMFVLRFDSRGVVRVAYEFTLRRKINPRQIGVVLTLDNGCRTLTWEREGQWTLYPADHIGRLRGCARASKETRPCRLPGPVDAPDKPWSSDATKLGSNDFRSTKENVVTAALARADGSGVVVNGQGRQHVRTWLELNKVRLLIADFSNAGAERFFRGHARREDHPLNPGDSIRGTAEFHLRAPAEKGEGGAETSPARASGMSGDGPGGQSGHQPNR